jgi:hypothetical protein
MRPDKVVLRARSPSQYSSTADAVDWILMGVPGDRVAVRLTEWPAHVALKADGQWHSLGTIGYQSAYARHDPELRWLGASIAAGFARQTATVATLTAGTIVIGADNVGPRLVWISIVVNARCLIGDLLIVVHVVRIRLAG